jgi:hypothetical protein
MEAMVMTREPETDQLKQRVAELVALEQRIEGLIDRQRRAVKDHPATAAAFERFHATSKEQRDRLMALQRELGEPRPAAGAGEAASPAPGVPGAPEPEAGGDAGRGTVSQALRDASLAFNDAAFGYSALHETAHVFDSQRYATTLRMAERHLRRYAAAVQEINQLIADVVAWELRQEGQFCECQCPACSLGICWCVAHTTDTINASWRDTAPAYPSSGLRVVPNLRRPADLDVREGDLVIAVDGQRVASTSDVTSMVMERGPGESITFGIERRPTGTLEVRATRKP